MIVTPLTKKAREKFIGEMEGNPEVEIIRREGRKILFVSKNGKYCAWMDLAKDRHWNLILR
jgi:hypothetical protein